MKIVESIGACFGILGALLVASKMPSWGYPLFTLSALMLSYTAWRFKQHSLLAMQGVYLAINLLGLFNYAV